MTADELSIFLGKWIFLQTATGMQLEGRCTRVTEHAIWLNPVLVGYTPRPPGPIPDLVVEPLEAAVALGALLLVREADKSRVEDRLAGQGADIALPRRDWKAR